MPIIGILSVNNISDADFDLIPDVVEVAISSNPLIVDDKDSDTNGLSYAIEIYLSSFNGIPTASSTIEFNTKTGSSNIQDYAAIGFSNNDNYGLFTTTAVTTIAKWMTLHNLIN